jgi:lysophospholipase L1-like esterase
MSSKKGLNGRTTVLDDPIEGANRNGLGYLVPCLESHAPVDLVVLMLGTNDLKARFSLTAYDIAMGVSVLINTIQASGSGPGMRAPEILLLCPPPLGKLTHHAGLFTNGVEESKKLAGNYKRIAKLLGCHFLDVGDICKPCDDDGLHYSEDAVQKLGKAVSDEVKKIFG